MCVPGKRGGSRFERVGRLQARSSGGEHFLDAEGARGSIPLAPIDFEAQPGLSAEN